KRGEPLSVQSLRYSLADLGARKGATIKLIKNHREMKGMSITLLSIKNSLRYFLTSAVEVLSGVPTFTSITPILALFLFMMIKRIKDQNYDLKCNNLNFTD